jgi:hypothetical protein
MKLRFLATGLAFLTILSVASAPSGASTAVSPYAQMKTVLADADAQTAMRYTVSLAKDGRKAATVTDSTKIGGRQVVTLSQAGISHTIVIELIAGALYVKGDSAILTSYLGLSKAVAAPLANKWFTIPKSNAAYPEVAQGISITSIMTLIMMTPSVSAGPAVTLSGVKAGVLKGATVKSVLNPSFGETLYFSTATKPLPIQVVQTFQGSQETTHFGHWDETVHLAVPKTKLQLK